MGQSAHLLMLLATGFAATQPVTISFAGTTVVTIPVNVNTDVFGYFNASLTIPTGQTVGGKSVNASDAISNSATATFAITPSISLSPNSGNIGSTVTGIRFRLCSQFCSHGKVRRINSQFLAEQQLQILQDAFTGATFTVPTWASTWATGSVQTVNLSPMPASTLLAVTPTL